MVNDVNCSDCNFSSMAMNNRESFSYVMSLWPQSEFTIHSFLEFLIVQMCERSLHLRPQTPPYYSLLIWSDNLFLDDQSTHTDNIWNLS